MRSVVARVNAIVLLFVRLRSCHETMLPSDSDLLHLVYKVVRILNIILFKPFKRTSELLRKLHFERDVPMEFGSHKLVQDALHFRWKY